MTTILSTTLPPTAQRGRQSPHKRLTTEQVKQHWLLGDYTASGYIIHLLGALKRDGWIVEISNVAEFCQEWQIGERRFYRAKSKLIEQGRLGERIKGNLQLWLVTDRVVPLDGTLEIEGEDSVTDKNVSETDESVSLADKNDSPSDSNDSATDDDDSLPDSNDSSPDSGDSPIASQASPHNRSSDPPDLSQISITSSSSLSHSHPPSPSEREEGSEDELEALFDAKGEPIAAFQDWLQRQAQKLPKPPALIGKWIAKQAQDEINQREFLKWHRGSRRRMISPLAIAPVENLAVDQNSQRLHTLRHWWAEGQFERVKESIAAHPEWELQLGTNGPEEVRLCL